MFIGPFDYSIIKNAVDKKLVDIEFVNIRDFGIGKHKIVDDKPYGGGQGMILRVDVLEKAIRKAKDLSRGSPREAGKAGKRLTAKNQMVILLDPRGKSFNQKKAKEFSKLESLILVCGHYEGIDDRIEKFIDEKISVGDFIVTGGEIPAMLVADAVIRLIKGSLKKQATDIESFSPYLEYPQYTRPKVYKNYSVPDVLLSGNHKKIEAWRKSTALKLTSLLRPDLLTDNKTTKD